MDQITPNLALGSDYSDSKADASACEDKKVEYFQICLNDLGYKSVIVYVDHMDDDGYTISIEGR